MGTGARAAGATNGARDRDGMTPAQWYCLLAGAALLLAGIFGFIADATFDTVNSGVDEEGGNRSGLQGDSFLGFEVNGWHNVVHLLSGLVLLSAFRKAALAKTVALAFGIVYGLVTIIGMINGEHVLGFIPVNGADNILHLLLSLLGIVAGLMSRARDHVTGHGASRGRDLDLDLDRGDRTGTSTEFGRGEGRVVAPADGTTPESRETTRHQRS